MNSSCHSKEGVSHISVVRGSVITKSGYERAVHNFGGLEYEWLNETDSLQEKILYKCISEAELVFEVQFVLLSRHDRQSNNELSVPSDKTRKQMQKRFKNNGALVCQCWKYIFVMQSQQFVWLPKVRPDTDVQSWACVSQGVRNSTLSVALQQMQSQHLWQVRVGCRCSACLRKLGYRYSALLLALWMTWTRSQERRAMCLHGEAACALKLCQKLFDSTYIHALLRCNSAIRVIF